MVIKKQCLDFGFGKNNMYLLPEFIDTELFKIDQDKTPSPAKQQRLLYVGRLVPCKGVDLLIKALANLPDKHVILDIVGNGPELARLKMLVKTNNLDNRVNFHSWINRDQLKDIYGQADIFVHPARWAEPLGITVVEALASGRPVIFPRISGSAWAAGQAGLTFQNGDQKDLAEKITRLLNDPKLYNQLLRRTKTEVKRMDYRSWVNKFETLINNVVVNSTDLPT